MFELKKLLGIPFGFVWFLFGSVVTAQSIPVTNPEMEMESLLVHGQPNLPAGWVLESGKEENVRAWNSPASAAVALGGGAVISQTVSLPPLEKRQTDHSDWKLLLAVDVTGKFSSAKGPTELVAAIEDVDSKQVLESNRFTISSEAPVAKVARPTVSASSFKSGSHPGRAFDGDRNTIWHTDYGANTPKYPHHLTLDFGETRTLKGVTYVPRKDGGNGTLKAASLQYTTDGARWRKAIQGEFKYQKRGEEQVIVLDKPIECRGIRLLCKSEIRGAAFASCAELIPDLVGGFKGLNPTEVEPRAEIQRCFLPVDIMGSDSLKKIKVSLSVKSLRYAVVDRVHLMYVPVTATKKLLGKANGHLGPDLLGAGSYGFKGMMVHQLPVLPIIEINSNSPAQRAKLKRTDLIVGINGQFLPPGNVAPGFEWLESSHESLLGRAAMGAFEAGQNETVTLQVLRAKSLVDVPIKLRLPSEISKPNFLTQPETLQLLNDDLVAKVVSSQSKNGSWNNDPIRTSLGGLALLSTGDAKHARRIKSAANWVLSRNSEPGPGWYWHPSFSGIFLCEYYLATGDDRALPVIERMLRMMGSSFHTSKWGTQTFGHGPKGLPYGNKSLVAVMVHVLVFEELAQRCGFESAIFERLTPYLESAWSDPAQGGHGAMGYNASYKDLQEFWSRTGLFGLKLKMSGQRPDMQKPLAEIMRKRHPWFRNSHAYGEPGGVLGFIGLSQMNPDYFQEVFQQYRWWFALAWEKGNGLHFTIPHMGAPYMESDELINNGYAIVTNIHKQNLCILGGHQRNWLDVSNVPVPLSEVLILQGTDGLVSLRCKIPGPKIHYTLDGSVPNRKSKRFDRSFPVEPGSVVRAIAISGSEMSPVAERGFGLDKTEWTIVKANGDADQQRAIERATFAIDGDHQIGWVPDQGEGASSYPYEFVVDMAESQRVELAGIRYVFNQGAASSILVEGSNDPNQGFKKLGEQRFEAFEKDARVKLDGSTVRYLKFIFKKPFAENSNLLMVGEVDIR